VKYAMVDGQRREAAHGLLGTCRVCNATMTPKCGRIRVAHWAHPQGLYDHSWEPETPWHRNWKGCFPEAWQESVHRASNGELHIADVKTQHGQVIEFQHSAIREEERISREAIYLPMCWMVDGLRLKWDQSQFLETLRCRDAVRIGARFALPVDKCTLLRKWADSRVLVFFDFGESILWASLPERKPKGFAILTPVYRKSFLEAMIKGEPLKGIAFKVFMPPVTRRGSLEHYMAQKNRARARIRF
jgi:competence protein CoiA